MKTFNGGRIVEISGLGLYLCREKGSIGVYRNDEKIGSVAFDDVQAMIFSSYDLCYSHKLLEELALRKIPVVFCDKKHLPSSMILPFDGYFHQSRRLLTQAQTSKPVNKQLWKNIIIAKITQQAKVLEAIGKKHRYLTELAKEVRSDDSTNCEGQASRYYFTELFGKDFVRNRDEPGINALLNYGYIVFRSAAARAVVSYGLNPSIGIKHCNPNNAMPLVDDVIEPFRAFVDIEVYRMYFEDGLFELDSENKKRLVSLLNASITASGQKTTPVNVMHKTASSLGRVYDGKVKKLYLPEMTLQN